MAIEELPPRERGALRALVTLYALRRLELDLSWFVAEVSTVAGPLISLVERPPEGL